MKKLVKLLLPSISVMLVAIMALTGATYAWFSQDDTARVDNIDVNVIEAAGIEVSFDAASFGQTSTLDLTGDEYASNDTLSGGPNTPLKDGSFKFKPLSTALGAFDTTTGAFKMYEAKLEGKTVVETFLHDESSGRGYIKYDIFFRINESPAEGKTTIPVNVTGISMDGKSKEGVVQSAKDTSALAMRVAFVNHGAVSLDDYSVDDALKQKASSYIVKKTTESNSCAEGGIVIYEPNATTHTLEGTQGSAANSKYAYKGVSQAAAGADAFSNALEDVVTEDTATDIVLQLKTGVNRVTVYVWLEGQDSDCTNFVASKGVNMGISFEKPKAAA